METLLEIIFGGIVEAMLVLLVKYPATFIVWCAYRFKKPFEIIIEDDSYLWGVLVLFLIAAAFCFSLIMDKP